MRSRATRGGLEESSCAASTLAHAVTPVREDRSPSADRLNPLADLLRLFGSVYAGPAIRSGLASTVEQMLLVIFGAGASYDCADVQHRPPLAKNLVAPAVS
jgi:hypothetical protein